MVLSAKIPNVPLSNVLLPDKYPTPSLTRIPAPALVTKVLLVIDQVGELTIHTPNCAAAGAPQPYSIALLIVIGAAPAKPELTWMPPPVPWHVALAINAPLQSLKNVPVMQP